MTVIDTDNNWSPCSVTCGRGYQYKIPVVSGQPEYRTCQMPPCATILGECLELLNCNQLLIVIKFNFMRLH